MEKQHSEKMKAAVIQVVPWEKRMKYFSRDGMDFGDTPVDLIVIGRIKPPGETWVKRLLQKYDYGTMLLDEGVPITVERPHKFKEGDVVELELTVSKE